MTIKRTLPRLSDMPARIAMIAIPASSTNVIVTISWPAVVVAMSYHCRFRRGICCGSIRASAGSDHRFHFGEIHDKIQCD